MAWLNIERLQERAESERRWNALVFGNPPSLLRLLVLAHALESDSLVADCHSQLLPVFDTLLSDNAWHAPSVRRTSIAYILTQLRADLLNMVQSRLVSDRVLRCGAPTPTVDPSSRLFGMCERGRPGGVSVRLNCSRASLRQCRLRWSKTRFECADAFCSTNTGRSLHRCGDRAPLVHCAG
jgi:hypothetical protein